MSTGIVKDKDKNYIRFKYEHFIEFISICITSKYSIINKCINI